MTAPPDRSPPPGAHAVVLAALAIGTLLMAFQLWMLTVALDLYLAGRGRDSWLLALGSGFVFLGGVLAAARLASSSQQAGTGDVNLNAIAAAVIGGTSLFGGRGSAYSALLGIIVIQAISNGLTLLNLPSSLRYMITGGVLAIAVIVDSLARRSRVSHGRA